MHDGAAEDKLINLQFFHKPCRFAEINWASEHADVMLLDGAHIRFQFRLARRAVRGATFRPAVFQVMHQWIDSRSAYIRIAFQVSEAVKFRAGAAPFQAPKEQVMPQRVNSPRDYIRIVLSVPEGVKIARFPQEPQVSCQYTWEDPHQRAARLRTQALKNIHSLSSKKFRRSG